MWDEVRAPPGAQHFASLRAITARQLQALVRRPLGATHRQEERCNKAMSWTGIVLPHKPCCDTPTPLRVHSR